MKKYFYSNGSTKDGPFTLEELKYGPKSSDINDSTLIWFEGLDDWTPVKEIEEFKLLLEMTSQSQVNKKVPSPNAELVDNEPSELEQKAPSVKIKADPALSQEKENHASRGTSPSKAKYIGVWFLAGCLFFLAQFFILNLLDGAIVSAPLISMEVRWQLSNISRLIGGSIISLLIFYYIYRRRYRELDIEKVLPYSLCLGTPIFVYINKIAVGNTLTAITIPIDEFFYATSVISFVLLNFFLPHLLMGPNPRSWSKRLMLGLLILIGVGIVAVSNLPNLYNKASSRGGAINQLEESSASDSIPQSVLILEKAARSLPASDWLGNVEAYERALAALEKEKDSISREQFKTERYLYKGKIEQYKNLGNTKTDDERAELLEDYLSKLVVSISKDLPKASEGVRIDSVKKSDTDLNIQVTATGKSSSHPVRSVLMEFACAHRELRVALVNGAQISLMLDSDGGVKQNSFRVDESKCHAEYGSMENYGDYDLSVEPVEGSAHPKIAAYKLTAYWFGYPKIMKSESCPVDEAHSVVAQEFMYYWSLLQLKLPPSKPVSRDFMNDMKNGMPSKIRDYVFNLVDKSYPVLVKAYKSQGFENSICEGLQAANQNILNRQIETLKSCVKGKCIYGGGGKAENISYKTPLDNIYPEGHPMRAMFLFAALEHSLESLKKLPECRSQKYRPLNHISFVKKYNAIYGLTPPSRSLVAKNIIKEKVSVFPVLDKNGDNVMDSVFSAILEVSKIAGYKNKRLCDAIYNETEVMVQRQFDVLDRCLNGECLNGVTP